jgi:hypothetical protein
MARKKLGEWLISQGKATPAEVEKALAHQQETGGRLGHELMQMGVVSEQGLTEALAASLGLPAQEPALDQADPNALATLRDRFCEANDVFPLSLERGKGRAVLTVAMADPLNLPAIEEMEFTTGAKVVPRLASRTRIREAIRKHYPRARAEPRRKPPPPPPEALLAGKAPRAAPDPYLLEEPATTPPPRAAQTPVLQGTIEHDLEYLVGEPLRGQQLALVEQVERRQNRLIALLTQKGLLTRDEVLKLLRG